VALGLLDCDAGSVCQSSFEGQLAFFRPRKSSLAGRRDVIFLLQDESRPSTGAEPGISVESNRCSFLTAKPLAKAAL